MLNHVKNKYFNICDLRVFLTSFHFNKFGRWSSKSGKRKYDKLLILIFKLSLAMYEHWFLISSPYWFMRQKICADLNNNKSHNTRSGVSLFCRNKIPRCTAHGKGRPYWRSPVFSHWPSPEERWGRAKKHAISEKDVEFECLDFLKVMMNILLSKRQNCLFTHRNGRRNLLELLHSVADLSKRQLLRSDVIIHSGILIP